MVLCVCNCKRTTSWLCLSILHNLCNQLTPLTTLFFFHLKKIKHCSWTMAHGQDRQTIQLHRRVSTGFRCQFFITEGWVDISTLKACHFFDNPSVIKTVGLNSNVCHIFTVLVYFQTGPEVVQYHHIRIVINQSSQWMSSFGVHFGTRWRSSRSWLLSKTLHCHPQD